MIAGRDPAAMRHRRDIRFALAAAAIVLAAARPVAAGQAPSASDLWDGAPGLPPPAATGKPAIAMPPALWGPEPQTCLPALPCGTHVIGQGQRDGAVIVEVPALRW